MAGFLAFVARRGPAIPYTWGALLSQGTAYLWRSTRLAAVPGVAIAVVVLGCNLLGDGLRDWLDPRGRASQGLRRGRFGGFLGGAQFGVFVHVGLAALAGDLHDHGGVAQNFRLTAQP